MADDPRLGLARRLYERTGDRDQVIAGMTGLGYGKAEAAAVVDQVAPAPSTPAPAGATPAPAPRTAARATSPTPPRAGASKPGRGSLFGGRGRGKARGISPTLTPPRRLDAGDVAGFGFGLVLYVLALNYLKDGPAGVKGWLSAKFLNRPYVSARTEPTTVAPGDDRDDGLTSTRPAPPVNA